MPGRLSESDPSEQSIPEVNSGILDVPAGKRGNRLFHQDEVESEDALYFLEKRYERSLDRDD